MGRLIKILKYFRFLSVWIGIIVAIPAHATASVSSSGSLYGAAIASFGSFLGPDNTHTFAVFVSSRDGFQSIDDFAVINWLPVEFDGNSVRVAGAIDTRNGLPRAGYSFPLQVAFQLAKGRPLTTEGLFSVDAQLFAKAKVWEQMLQPSDTEIMQMQNGQAVSGRYLYVADDRKIFKNSNNPRPFAFNCFHAVTALSEVVLPTGIFSGNTAGVMTTRHMVRTGAFQLRLMNPRDPRLVAILQSVANLDN